MDTIKIDWLNGTHVDVPAGMERDLHAPAEPVHVLEGRYGSRAVLEGKKTVIRSQVHVTCEKPGTRIKVSAPRTSRKTD